MSIMGCYINSRIYEDVTIVGIGKFNWRGMTKFILTDI